jgi:PcRGLX-like N-terminal RIFT barrel domain/PcRGLX-like protein central beta sandwich domain/PcRGLX-like protein C-terminal alpha/alpha toroid domain
MGTFRTLAACALLAIASSIAIAKPLPDKVCKALKLPPNTKTPLKLVTTDENRKDTPEQVAKNAPDITRLEAGHIGDDLFLFKVTFDNAPDLKDVIFIIYADLDNNTATGRKGQNAHKGTDAMLVIRSGAASADSRNLDFPRDALALTHTIDGKDLYILLEAPLDAKKGVYPMGLHLLCERKGGRSDGTKKKVVKLPAQKSLATAGAADAKPAADADGDGISDAVEDKLCSPKNVKQEFKTLLRSPNRRYSEEQAARNAPDILKLEACHLGGQRILFRTTFAHKPDFNAASYVLYLDLDNNPKTGRDAVGHEGVDVMAMTGRGQISGGYYENYSRANTKMVAAISGRQLYTMIDAPLYNKGGEIAFGTHLLCQRAGGRGDGARHVTVAILSQPKLKPIPLPAKINGDLRSLEEYRYVDNKVKLERLEDKGLTRAQVTPEKPKAFGRPRPQVRFITKPQAQKMGDQKKTRKVEVRLKEETGVDRANTPVSFGFPLPKGALYNVAHFNLLSKTGKTLPFQAAATSFWPDKSLRWVLIDTTVSLKANEESSLWVEYHAGAKWNRAPSPSIKVAETTDAITITTGPMKVRLDRARFTGIGQVWYEGKQVATTGEGVRLVDEHGSIYTTANRRPIKIRLEEQGPEKVVVRVAGQYGDAKGTPYMDYITRLTFRVGSPRIDVAHTHINTNLEHEFSDIDSLTMPIRLTGNIVGANTGLGRHNYRIEAGKPLTVFQKDDRNYEMRCGDRRTRDRRHPGAIRMTDAKQRSIGVAVQDFWQLWPKGFTLTDKNLTIDILPKQPGKDYGKGLPHYLLYPFVKGKYRMKWGMAFTTRMTFDFSGKTSLDQLAAEANKPVIAVLPAAHYAETKALGRIAAPMGKQFAQWDAFVLKNFKAHMKQKDRNREYGFLNYGDWYGERGRNWGNNEYDLAHGMILQFARTGNRDYFRMGQAAARHQTDSDIVHAYPDPTYVGGNHPHSIGHTGMISHQAPLGTWSYKYAYHTMAKNGHTWAQGMMEAWYLTGEARIMEGCYAQGEHIAWFMAPAFDRLGSHERSAGWSLRAISAIYRGTNDPEYLRAAKQIAAIVYKEQRFDKGGAWPHKLPGGHARGVKNTYGNNVFLIGVLLNGLAEYYDATGDPAARKAFLAGAKWIAKSFDDDEYCWPYSASWDGKDYGKPTPGVNNLIVGSMAWAGKLSGKARYYEIAEKGLSRTLNTGASSIGKNIAQQMVYTPDTLALLQQYHAAHSKNKGIKALDGSADSAVAFLLRSKESKTHDVRSPDVKVFHIKLAKRNTLIATRKRHGALPKKMPFGTIKILNEADKLVADGRYDTDKPHVFTAQLKAGLYKVVIHDDQRSRWSLSGKGVKIVMETVRNISIGGVGRRKLHFFVPKGTKSFSIKLRGVHTGGYGAVVIAPDGKAVKSFNGANNGSVRLKGATKTNLQDDDSDQALITVSPAAKDTGKAWSLVLHAVGDIGCELKGIPPYLALTKDALFAPK